MRTTLEIDDVVLSAARSLARADGITLGAAVSKLVRRDLARSTSGSGPSAVIDYSPFPVLIGDPRHRVTPELVDAHGDDGEDQGALSPQPNSCEPPSGGNPVRLRPRGARTRPRGVRWMNPCWIRYGS